MLFNAASRAAQSPAAATPSGVGADFVQALGNLFYLTTPVEPERAAYSWWLLALVLGGAVVRFWDLGAVGLHGDEETMAMAARHILIDGRPILPSGMFYPRGMTQLYLMALSMSLFGESEWALRLPSALCGVALIGLSYAAGRRFLRPQWNLAFAATIAFLPSLIIDSQTARMYIFLVTFIMASMACLSAWERSDRNGWLLAAIAALILGLDMQALAVAGILMFLLPGVVRGDLRKLMLGASAALAVLVAFMLIRAWVGAQYPVPPPEFAAGIGPPLPQQSHAPRDFELAFDIALWGIGLVIACFALHLSRAVVGRAASIWTALLLLTGIGLQLALYYHLAAIVYLAGVVVALRYGSPQATPRLVILLIAVGLLTLVHVSLLASASGTFIRLVGAMVGQPSVWPYVRLAELSPAAGVLTAALLAWGLFQLAQHRQVSDYWLLAVVGVWAPVFAVGVFAWNVPSRYTAMSLAPMLLCAFAFAQHGADRLLARWSLARGRTLQGGVAAALIATLCVNPASAAATINAGYRMHPDHKGAAEFMRSLQLTDDDIVLAEDVLQQTWYLGSVDYWLIGPRVARRFIKRAEHGVVDFYTGTPVIATPAMLDELLQESPGKRVFIIGSGEDQRNNRRFMRGDELHAVIESGRFRTLHIARDGKTRILQAVPGVVTPSTSTHAESETDAAALAEHAATAAQGRCGAATKASTPASAPAKAE